MTTIRAAKQGGDVVNNENAEINRKSLFSQRSKRWNVKCC